MSLFWSNPHDHGMACARCGQALTVMQTQMPDAAGRPMHKSCPGPQPYEVFEDAARPASSVITTHHGVRIDLLDPKPTDIFLADIIYGLSRVNRWGGHFEGPWLTVAQHSVDVFDLVLASQGVVATLPVLRAALLHDAAEAYMGDIVKPLKDHVRPMQVVEERLMSAIARRFDVPDVAFHSSQVRWADSVARAWEQRDNRRAGDFRLIENHEHVPTAKHVAMHPEVANAAMWKAATRLGLVTAGTRKP